MPAVRVRPRSLAIASALAWIAPVEPGLAADPVVATVVTLETPFGETPTVSRSLLPPGDPDAPEGPPPVGIQNGDFSSGLDGWTASEDGGSSAPGTLVVVDEAAVFSEGDSFLVSLRQTFVVPPNVVALRFDLAQVPGFDQTDAFIPDAFEASLLDGALEPVVPTWDPLATSFFNVQEDGALLLASGVTVFGTTVTLDLTGVPAASVVTLYFDLIGGDLDQESGVTLDGVLLEAVGCDVFPAVSTYGQGWPGTLGIPTVTVTAAPTLGTTLSLEVSNSYGPPTLAIGFLSLAQDAAPTPYGGTLLVSLAPTDRIGIWAFTIPAATVSVDHWIGDALEFCGVPVHGQVVVQDPGASDGFAFSAGTTFVLGG